MGGLSDLLVRNIKAGESRREIPDADSRGLYLVVQPSGVKSFALRYRIEGVARKFTIGGFPEISLKEARRRAEIARGKIAAGLDPSAEKVQARREKQKAVRADRDRVAAVVNEFIEKYAKRQTRSWQETERMLKKEIVAPWGGRAIAEITRRDVHELLDALVDRPAPVLANRVLANFRRLCNWCVERGILESSPCDKVKPPASEVSRDRVLSDDELRAVWIAAEGAGWPFGVLLKLLILTGQRRDECAQMRWDEIDWPSKTWILPKARTKNGLEHHVPLSAPVLAILESIPRLKGAAFVLTTTGHTPISGFSKAKERVEGAVLASVTKNHGNDAKVPRWTLHDMRRTMASGMARLGVPLPIIEKVLNHTSGSFAGIVGVYQRHSYSDEKRAALELWAQHVTQPSH